MAHYVCNATTPEGQAFRQFVSDLNSVLHRAEDLNALLAQMSSDQVSARYGFSDGVATANATTAGSAKAELLADLGKILTDASVSGVYSALKQLLAEFA